MFGYFIVNYDMVSKYLWRHKWCFSNFYTVCVFGPGGLCAPSVLACAMRSLAIGQSFFLSFFLSPSFAFDPLRGISRVRKFVSPNILAELEEICKKKCKFIFSQKKTDFRVFCRLFTASFRSRSPGPHTVPGVFSSTTIINSFKRS